MRYCSPSILLSAMYFAALPHVMGGDVFSDAQKRFDQASAAGFHWKSSEDFPQAFQSGQGASDDGRHGLPVFGGIGTGTFGRDLQGRFSRWQLQPGFPRVMGINSASLCVRWQQGEKNGAWRLGEGEWDRPLPAQTREVAALWPLTLERLKSPDWPVEIIVESWSPVLPKDDHASSLPLVFFDVSVRNHSKQAASVDLACFMPNFLGWRPGSTRLAPPPSKDQAGKPSGSRVPIWPDWSHGGNYAEAVKTEPGETLRMGVLFRNALRQQPTRDMEGEVLLGVAGGPSVVAQQIVCGSLTSLGAAESAFFSGKSLPAGDFIGSANHNEPLFSAVSGGVKLAPGATEKFTLLIVWDLPLIEFGAGRTWEKKYTAQYGADGKQACRMAGEALRQHDAWLRARDAWHQQTLGNGSAAERKRRGAAINDLSYVISGGTAWVAKQHSANGLEPPLLGVGEHFSILEGYDSGYHFSNTFDLWPHAQAAFEANWPTLSGLVLKDYLASLPLSLTDKRNYRDGHTGVRKLAYKVPHDLGAPPGDPWHILNEYNGNRDSNVWKDHNPAFLLSLYLHRKHQGMVPPENPEWKELLRVVEFMFAQDNDQDGLPDHDAQGDSTWDALHFTGPSPYSSGLTIGALAAMADWSRQRGDATQQQRFEEKLKMATTSFDRHFWTGKYYRAAPNGEQADWILADALFGILLADAAGLSHALPREHIAGHLRMVAERNWRGFDKGRIGPALLAPPTGEIPSGLQVGEVIIGSARSSMALMQRYGLSNEAAAMADALNHTLYERSGLQFRVPAAITPAGTFRAPSNLRPLASWYSLWPTRQ